MSPYRVEYALHAIADNPAKHKHVVLYPKKITPEKILNGRVILKEFYFVIGAKAIYENRAEIEANIELIDYYFYFSLEKPEETDGIIVWHIPKCFIGKRYSIQKKKPPLIDRIIVRLFFNKEWEEIAQK